MAFVLIWFGLIAVLGSVLTLDAPSWPHLVGIVPAAALLAAVALEQILVLCEKTFGLRAGVYISVLLLILLAKAGYGTWDQYYSAVKDNAPATVVVGRYINRLPLDVTSCSLVSGPSLSGPETAFLAWPHKYVILDPDAPEPDLGSCSGKSLVWFISPENMGRFDAIRARWPHGLVQNHTFPGTDYTLTFYLVNVAPPALPVK